MSAKYNKTKMNHELAKKLKDAGFPQPDKYSSGKSGVGYDISGDLNQYDNCCGMWGGDYTPDAYVPTLSELIEACNPTDNYCVLLNITKSWSSASMGSKIGSGSTPEEALGKLWLALQEKQSAHCSECGNPISLGFAESEGHKADCSQATLGDQDGIAQSSE
jgi:hypothetical protein